MMDDVSKFTVSFELFPPKTTKGFVKFENTCRALQILAPRYFSVTYGAGGSNDSQARQAIQYLINNQASVAPHLTCIGLSRKKLCALLNFYRVHGIKRLVVLRGDGLTDQSNRDDEFDHADELIGCIREITNDFFCIEVAAYPEFHPEASNAFIDLHHFRKKVMAGADRAITQYFYNTDAYFRFIESCQKMSIDIPIIPGIMPIANFQKLRQFSKACGAEIPLWLSKRLESYGDDNESIKAYGIEVVTKLCMDLIGLGVKELHFYTLNNVEPTRSIIYNLLASDYVRLSSEVDVTQQLSP